MLLNMQFNLLNMNRYVPNAIALGPAWNYCFNVTLGGRDTAAAD